MIKARNDNVLVVLEMSARRTNSGILLPDSLKFSEFGKAILAGVVLSVGDKCPGVQEDDRVLFHCEAGDNWFVGVEVPHDALPNLAPGTELRMCRHDEIIAVVE